MSIELTKKQIMSELQELIEYDFNTGDYEKFLIKHLKEYSKFEDAYFEKIFPLVEKLKIKADKQYESIYGNGE